MIEHQKIGGREATIAYIKSDMTPCDPEEAELIKIIFEDGETMWLAGDASSEIEKEQP